MVHGVPSNIDLIEQLGVVQLDVYSHKIIEFSAVQSSMLYFFHCNSIINHTQLY